VRILSTGGVEKSKVRCPRHEYPTHLPKNGNVSLV
jgi:hypothetical protein